MGRSVSFSSLVKKLLDRRGLRSLLIPLVSHRARTKGKGLKRIFYDHGVWIHESSSGYFVFHEPVAGLDMANICALAREHFLWGYTPSSGDVVLDVGAGVGEEALLFSRQVGERGKVICVEGHPRTHRCLEQLIKYNNLTNTVSLQLLVTEPDVEHSIIEDSHDYLTNSIMSSVGFSVGATTVDAIYQKLGLDRVNFMKMNIEGAERLAMKGMTEALKRTEVLCISCHDFLAEETGNEFFRTKSAVREFLQHHGLKVVERLGDGLPPYLRDQLWAYNENLKRSVQLTGSPN